MLLPCKYWHVLARGRRIAWLPVPLLLYQMWAFNILSVMCLSLTFSGLEKKLNSTPSFGQAAALSHILLSWINYLLVLVDDLIVQNDLPSYRCHLGKYKALKDYCPTRKFTGPWLPNGTFFEPCFVFLYFVILFLLFFPIHLLQVLLPQLPFTWKTSSRAFVTSAHG